MSVRFPWKKVRTFARLSRWLLLLSLGLSMLALWLMYPLAVALSANAGHDFFLVLAAAKALHDHQNPYDPFVIVRYAHASGMPLGYLITQAHQPKQPYVYPPLLAWLVTPLTYINPAQALAVWRVLSSGAILVGTYGLTAPWSKQAQIFDPRTRRLLLGVLVLLAPVTVFALYWGNPVALVYGALGAGIWALARNQAWSDIVAGALMSVTLLKPQLALPLAVLAALCFLQDADAWQRRWRMLSGFVGATALLLLLDLLVTGPQMLLDWPGSILYLAHLSNGQPDMPSLMGLLWTQLSRLPNGWYMLIGLAILGLTILVVALLYWRLRHGWAPEALFGLLTVIWCFGTPYAHANDEILLVPAGLALVAVLYGITRNGIVRRLRVRHLYSVGMASDLLRAALAAFALVLLYLGGVVRFVHYHAHQLSTNVAAAVVPLALLIALGALMLSKTRFCWQLGRTP